MSIYDIRPDNFDGALWTVFDSRTLEPATVQGRPCIGLSLHEADSLADALNQSHEQKREAVAAG
jgi:hypothetical protein